MEMTLILGIYFQSFRAALISSDGTILGIYRLSNSLRRNDGFYDFPIDDVVEYLLKQDIEIKAIQQVLIVGKPIIFFEKFLKECLIPPKFNNVVRFRQGVGLFFEKVLRIKRDINRALRHEPEFSFLPAVEACLRIPEFLNWCEDILILEPINEYGHSMVIQGNGKIRMVDSELGKELHGFQKSQDFKRKMEILTAIRKKLGLEKELVVSNPFDGQEVDGSLSSEYFFDAPTLVLFAMCDLYFKNMGSFPSYTFKERFSQLIGLQGEGETIDLKLNSEVLANLWKNHSAFHTISVSS